MMVGKTTSPDGHRSTIAVLLVLAAAMAGALLAAGPIPQDPAYHGFADQRAILGIPNGLDVLSNIPFLLVGGLGLSVLASRGIAASEGRLRSRWELTAWLIVFAAVTAVAFGSSHYHLAPDNERLVWDRLPITVAFTSVLALVIGERLSMTMGRYCLIPFILVGLWSAWAWHQSEMAGAGDMRLYIFVQAYPIIAIPTLLALRPPIYTEGPSYLVALGRYALAKVCEVLDGQILELTGQVSGHTIKHLLAAGGIAWILRMLNRRRPLVGSPQDTLTREEAPV